MEQLKMKITDTQGKDWGDKKVMAMHWNKKGELWMVSVDFMESSISNEFLCLYKNNNTGEFVGMRGNLKGEFLNNVI